METLTESDIKADAKEALIWVYNDERKALDHLGLYIPNIKIDRKTTAKVTSSSLFDTLDSIVSSLEDYARRCDVISLAGGRRKYIVKPYLSEGLYEAMEGVFDDALSKYSESANKPYVLNKYANSVSVPDRILNSKFSGSKKLDRAVSAYNRFLGVFSEYEFVGSLEQVLLVYNG